MQSSLYSEPYEKGLQEGELKGMERGIEKGRKKEKIGVIVRFLTKRFGVLPADITTQGDGGIVLF